MGYIPNAIADAETSINSNTNIHDSYVALYDAYFALTLNTDKTKLASLIDEVNGYGICQ